jgi:amino acid transporter
MLATAEEVEDASLVVPQCMWWSYLLNIFMAIIVLVTMLFCIGDLGTMITSPAPYLDLFNNTGSVGVALLLLIILFLLIFLAAITALATTSRETWAFSRDKGFPFSSWISRVSHLAGCR